MTDDAVQVDKRAAAWFFFTFYPRVLTEHTGTVYLAPIADSAGQPLQGGETYKLRVPKDIPAMQFWSLTMYDRRTWAFVNNPLDRAGLGSFNIGQMKVNADGSVDLYVGPKAPAGLESNWIPTMGKKPYLWLRLYAPEETFWSKAFKIKMPDLELVGLERRSSESDVSGRSRHEVSPSTPDIQPSTLVHFEFSIEEVIYLGKQIAKQENRR